ncbi:MAG: hypothetical protein QNJ98_01555 [Planctomycetota bacterium]|nr:hypothetical protein [Planctomycetota bacterium]
MRPALVLALLFVALAPPAHAGEAPDPDANAARVGRLLLADDDAKRAEGEALLLARIAKGGDLKAYVRRMADAARTWANDDSRLVETWIRQAVTGDMEQRERAVRLITAMGEKAVMRLALELRHHTRHLGNDAQAGAANEQTMNDAPAASEPAPQVMAAAVPHTPRVYDVTALRQKGMNPVQVLNFLRKEADASEVGSGPTRFVVYAAAAGHQRLAKRLSEIRVEVAKQKKADTKQQAESEDAGDADDGLPPPPAAPVADNAGGVKRAAPDSGAADGLDETGARWSVEPMVVRVPRDASLAERLSTWKAMKVDVITPFLAPAQQSQRKAAPTSASVVGAADAIADWFEKAPALPEARTAYGERLKITPGRAAKGFVGREVPYRRTVRQAKKSGAWRVDQDILQSGLELRFQLTTKAEALALRVDARLSEVSKPMATTQVRPEKGAEPIELDVPEWNRQSRSDTFEIARAGGGLLMVMADPAKADQGLVLILLRVKPAEQADAAQQMRQNMNPNGAPPAGRRAKD